MYLPKLGTGRKLPQPPQKANLSAEAPAEAKKRSLPQRPPQRSDSARAALSTLTSLREEKMNSDFSKIETLSQLYAHIANLTVRSAQQVGFIDYNEMPLYKKIDELVSFLKIGQQFSVEILLDSKDGCERLYERVSNILSDSFFKEEDFAKDKDYQISHLFQNESGRLENLMFEPCNVSLLKIQDILFCLKNKTGYKERKNPALLRSIVFCFLELQSKIEDFMDSLHSTEIFNKKKNGFTDFFWNHLDNPTVSASTTQEINVFDIEQPDEEFKEFLSDEEILTNNISGLEKLHSFLKENMGQNVHAITSINFSIISVKLNEVWSILSASQGSAPALIKTKVENLFFSKVLLQEKKPSVQPRIYINQNGALRLHDALAVLSYIAQGGQFQQGNGFIFTEKLKKLVNDLILSINAVVELRQDKFSTPELVKIVAEDLYQILDIALNGMAGNNEPFYYFTNPAPTSSEPRERFVRRAGALIEMSQPVENTRQLPAWMQPKSKRNDYNPYYVPPFPEARSGNISPAASTVSTELEFEAEMPEADPFSFYPRPFDEDFGEQLHVQSYALKTFYFFSKQNNFDINDNNRLTYAQKAELVIEPLKDLVDSIFLCKNIISAKLHYKKILRTLSKLAPFRNIAPIDKTTKSEISINFGVNMTLENMRDIFFLLDNGSNILQPAFKLFISNSHQYINTLCDKLLEVHTLQDNNESFIKDLCIMNIEPLLFTQNNNFYSLQVKNGQGIHRVSQERLLSRARVGDASPVMQRQPETAAASYLGGEWSDFSDDEITTPTISRPSSTAPSGDKKRGFHLDMMEGKELNSWHIRERSNSAPPTTFYESFSLIHNQFIASRSVTPSSSSSSSRNASPGLEKMFDSRPEITTLNDLSELLSYQFADLHTVSIKKLLRKLQGLFNFCEKNDIPETYPFYPRLINVVGFQFNLSNSKLPPNTFLKIIADAPILRASVEATCYYNSDIAFFKSEILKPLFVQRLMDALSVLIYHIDLAQSNQPNELLTKLREYLGNNNSPSSIEFLTPHGQVVPINQPKLKTEAVVEPEYEFDFPEGSDIYDTEWDFDLRNKSRRKHLFRLRRSRHLRYQQFIPKPDIRTMTPGSISAEIAEIEAEINYEPMDVELIPPPLPVRSYDPKKLPGPPPRATHSPVSNTYEFELKQELSNLRQRLLLIDQFPIDFMTDEEIRAEIQNLALAHTLNSQKGRSGLTRGKPVSAKPAAIRLEAAKEELKQLRRVRFGPTTYQDLDSMPLEKIEAEIAALKGRATRPPTTSGHPRPFASTPVSAPIASHAGALPTFYKEPEPASRRRSPSPVRTSQPLIDKAAGTTMNMFMLVGKADKDNLIERTLEQLVGLPVSVVILVDSLKMLNDFQTNLDKITAGQKLKLLFLLNNEVHPFKRGYRAVNLESLTQQVPKIYFGSPDDFSVPTLSPTFLLAVQAAKETLKKGKSNVIALFKTRAKKHLNLENECFIDKETLLNDNIEAIKKTTLNNIITCLESEIKFSPNLQLISGLAFFKKQLKQIFIKTSDQIDEPFFEKKLEQLETELNKTVGASKEQIDNLKLRIQKFDEMYQYFSRKQPSSKPQ